MGSRTIAISDDVYSRLAALKRRGESFSRLLGRLAGRPSLLELAGALPKERVVLLRRAVEEGRSRSRARRDREVKGSSSTRRS